VEFRSEAYDIFNHTNLYLLGSSLGGTLSTPTLLEPRILQFGLKVNY
jgi:hypothetical protein